MTKKEFELLSREEEEEKLLKLLHTGFEGNFETGFETGFEETHFTQLKRKNDITNSSKKLENKEINQTNLKPPIGDFSTVSYTRVKEMIEENDTRMDGGIFYNIDNPKLKQYVRHFNEKEQYLLAQNKDLYTRVKEVLSYSELNFAFSSWEKQYYNVVFPKQKNTSSNPSSQRDRAASGQMKTALTKKVNAPFDVESVRPEYNKENLAMIEDLQKREVVYKMLKRPNPDPVKLKEELKKLGYEGENAVGAFILDQKGRTQTHGPGGKPGHPSKEKEYLNFFKEHAKAKAFGMMELSEKLLKSESQTIIKGIADGIKTELKKYNGWFNEIRDVGILEFSPNNFGLMNAYEKAKKLNKIRREVSQKYPILLDEEIDLIKLYEDYVIDDGENEDLNLLLENIVINRYEDILNAKRAILTDSELIWKLDRVIDLTKDELLIADGGIFDYMISEKVKRVIAEEEREKLVLAVINIAFALISLGTSGVLSTAAFLISATAGGIEAYNLYKEYNQKSSATHISHDEKMALVSKYPDVAWVVISVVGTLLDFASALRILANFTKLRHLGKVKATIETTEDVLKLESHIDELAEGVDNSKKVKRILKENILGEANKVIKGVSATEEQLEFVRKAGGELVEAIEHRGYRYAEADTVFKNGKKVIDTSILDEAISISNRTDDVPKIADNLIADTGIPEANRQKLIDIIEQVKAHYWKKEHLIEIEPGKFTIGRFARDADDIRQWKHASNGFETFEEVDRFIWLLQHEYIELKLMKSGIPFRGTTKANWVTGDNYPTPKSYGAHDLSSNFRTDVGRFSHWKSMMSKNIPDNLILKDDLSNLDEIVEIIRKLENK